MASTSASTSTSTTSPHRAPQQGTEEDDDDEALFAALEAELDLDSHSDSEPGLRGVRQDAGTEHRGFLASGDGSASVSASASRSGGGFDLEGYRERRMREMREDLSSRRGRSSSSSDEAEETDSARPSEGVGAAEHFGLASSSTGRYLKFTAEKEVIALLEKAAKADTHGSSAGARGGGGGSRVVLHFSHPDFARCKIMDGHLERLASAHPSTLFIGISPLSAPFLVRKLRVKVLPHLVCFVEGAARDRLVGFEELGNTDGFRLEVLEERLGMSGVLTPRSRRNAGRPILGFPSAKADDDGDDWD